MSSPKTVTASHLEVFDPGFKFMYLVPSHLVVHTPPARLNISRLVVCRNYTPGKEHSCVKEENCRFVHANVDYDKLQAQSVHVNYIWRHEDICTYKRLPAGDVLEVVSCNGRKRTDLIPSERILLTRRAFSHQDPNGSPLSHCVHFYCNRMCNRGENCNFIHAIYVDPTITRDFQRAPAQPIQRFNVNNRSSRTETSDSPISWENHFTPSSPHHGSLHPMRRSLPPTPSQPTVPVTLPMPTVLSEWCEAYDAKSASAPDGAKTTPLDGSDSCLQSSGVGRAGSSTSSISRPGPKGLEGLPAALPHPESPGGITASPSASTLGANLSVSQTPQQHHLSSLCIGTWGMPFAAAAAAGRRSYRHNPYLPVHSSGVEG
ncbi:hypothetical protein LSM04_007978 [Trypanosoma melophagium]|uniref:uncharacterized protein n=1 Tax=Trypanosoma melophagium TaxID=715481 RepID=UPI003519D97E|nr:hypothetical protein LSM04_007978 [Trypanosoma melophagium]